RTLPGPGSERAASHRLRTPRTERIERLVAHTGATPSAATVFGETAISLEEHDRLHGLAVATVAEFHRRYPLRPGIPTATLASRLGGTAEIAVASARECSAVETPGATGRPQGGTAR